MEKYKTFHSKNGFALFLIIMFILWTGILFYFGVKQYHFSKNIQENLTVFVKKKGFSKVDVLHLQNEADKKETMITQFLDCTNNFAYFRQKGSSLPKKEEKSIVKLASHLPGQMAEKGEKEEENTQTNSQKETKEESVKQDIILFNNGGGDITAANKNTGKKFQEQSAAYGNFLDSKKDLISNHKMITKINHSYSRSYLLKKFYITDSSTSIDNGVFQVRNLLNMNLKIKKGKNPQILILHTHGASESFIDSRKGKKEDSIIGVGSKLAKILSEQYGYEVLHDKTEYDRIGGRIDRNKAYNQAYKGIKKTLKKYPSIEVIIDLHRDGVGNKVNRTTRINGRKTAQVMLFNGLSRNSSGNIAYLKNKNLQGNLAFSLQLKIESMKRFQNFAKPIYLKSYRYNMHLKKRYTLIELGNENNTVTQAKNAAKPLAMVLDAVLSGH